MVKTGSTAFSVLKLITVANIKLDLENPRYYEALMKSDLDKWTDKKLQDHILAEDDVSDIIGSIRMK